MRRCFFDQVLTQNNAHFITLAHHAQDQQETFFMRLIRGTTLSGLGSMEPIDGRYIRPLLEVNKADIINYLEQNQIKYLTDSTNLSDDYLRNRIRKYVIPALKKCDTRFDLKFKSTLQQVKLEDAFLKKLAQQEFVCVFIFNPTQNQWVGDLNKFFNLDPVLQRRVVLFWLIKENLKFSLSSKYLDEILRFLNSERGGKHQISANWSLLKNKNLFKIETH
jgi:tRNA(Ile)-lysidine synthase